MPLYQLVRGVLLWSINHDITREDKQTHPTESTMTYTIPDYLKEQAAADVDRTGEVSDATKEAIAAWVDSQNDD